MLQAFAITFSDGLEAFLVIAVAIAFLRKTRQQALVPAVIRGIAVSVITSLIGAWLFSRAENQVLWEGRFALAAAAAVAGLAAYMWRTRRWLRDGAVREPTARPSVGIGLAFFLLTALVVSREGMHTVLLIGTFVFQIRVPDLTIGVVSGLVLAGLTAWLWARYGHRLRLSLFLPITAIILAVAIAQLVSDAVQNLANANAPETFRELEAGPER